MRGDTQTAFNEAHRVLYALQEQVENELDNCGDKMLITLLEFAETIRQLSMSLNDEMIYEINHQVSYDPRSYECNLCNCVSKSPKKSGLQQGLNP